MSLSDILGSIGVSLLLIAFLLNLKGIMSPDNKWYIIFNIIGAALCGYSSYLIKFYPFVILEAVWVIAAFSSLIRHVPRGTVKK
ncbi:MAG: CBU_0592 family membrane protein [Daejeonella sp.]